MATPQTIVAKQEAVVAEAQAAGSIPSVVAKAQIALDEAIAFAGGALPSYVPPVGTFAEFTLNRPVDAGSAAQSMLLSHWSGGALIRDYSAHGGVAYNGGREHAVYLDQGGVLMLNIEARRYEMRCLPLAPHWSPAWLPGPSGSGAAVSGTLVQLPATANLSSLTANKSKLNLAQATNLGGKNFLITAIDNTLKTLTVDVAPEGITSSNWTTTTFSGPATDEYGAMEPDAYPSRVHTYNGLQEMPAAWGGGPKGSLVIFHSGGTTDDQLPTTGQGLEGLAALWRWDVSQPTHGVSRLTGNGIYNLDTAGVIPARTNDAPCTGIDYQREGWWCKQRVGSVPSQSTRICFTSKSGQITSYPSPLLTHAWAQIHHFEDEDLLCIIAGYNHPNSTIGTFVSVPPDKPGAQWQKVPQAGLEAAIAPAPVPTDQAGGIGYMGMRWCSHPNYQCFIGFPNWNTLRIDDTHILLLLLTPPPVGQRMTGTWQWTSEIVQSHDGSVMKVGVGLAASDHAIVNGSFGKLVYCEPLRSLVWTRSAAYKGQLIRLSRMD